WMKIKIDRSSDGYKLLYAPLDATTYSEVTIPKSSSHNFSFFSLLNQQVVVVEPEKEAWDIKFSTFTNEISGYGSYFYSDFVLTNAVSGVGLIKLMKIVLLPIILLQHLILTIVYLIPKWPRTKE